MVGIHRSDGVDALVSPSRVVIDVNPGEFGAGKRVEQMEA